MRALFAQLNVSLGFPSVLHTDHRVLGEANAHGLMQQDTLCNLEMDLMKRFHPAIVAASEGLLLRLVSMKTTLLKSSLSRRFRHCLCSPSQLKLRLAHGDGGPS